MNVNRVAGIVLVMAFFLLLTACEEDSSTNLEYSPAESGVFISDTLDVSWVQDASCSRQGDVFLLASQDIRNSSELTVYGVSSHGQIRFDTQLPDLYGQMINATADFGCITSRGGRLQKIESDGTINWSIPLSAGISIPRVDKSIILAGPGSIDDSLFHVGALNQLGVALWERSIARRPHEYFSQGCITSDGEIALLTYVNMRDEGFWPPVVEPVPILGIHIMSADGSRHEFIDVEDPLFTAPAADFASDGQGGFYAAATKIVLWDANGSIVWDYLPNVGSLQYKRLKVTADGGILVLLARRNTASMELQRFDASHNLVWTRSYGDLSSPIYPVGLGILEDDRIQVVGLTNDNEVVIYREEDTSTDS